MKILTVLTYYSPHWTGLTAHAAKVAEGLAARGHEVTVLTIRYRPDLARDEMVNGVRVVRVQPLARFSRGMITPAFPWAAAQLIRQHDTVQIHTPLPEAPIVAVLCRLLRRPLLMTHHGDLVMPPGMFSQALQSIGFWLTLWSGQMATAVTSYSKDYADNSPLLRRLRRKVTPVYPPVEFPEPNAQAAADWKTELGLHRKTLIGISGRWVREKGFDVLLEALPKVIQSIPDAHLLFVGEREVAYENFYQNCLPMIEDQSENLTFLGLILDKQKIADFYSMCDVFALPSRTDMMALTQVEAMLCGTPVVASDIPGARVVVRETGFGLLAPPEDPRGLADVLIEALNRAEELRPTPSEVQRIFDVEKSLDAYESLLDPLGNSNEKLGGVTTYSSANGSNSWNYLTIEDVSLLDALLSNEADMAFRRRARILMDYLELAEGDRVIDLGCGMGFYLMVIDRLRRVQLFGLDQERDRLLRAQTEVERARLLEGDILTLPFDAESFDKILLSEVLEHIEDDGAALDSIFRLLKPGGLLAISVPHARYPFWWDPINRTVIGMGGAPIRKGPIVGIWTNHERLYLPSELETRLVTAGFEVEVLEQATHYCFPLIHFLVYGIGKPLLERDLLPQEFVNSADRFSAERNSRSYLNPINLGVAAFQAVDQFNERASTAKKDSFVNVLVKARKPLRS